MRPPLAISIEDVKRQLDAGAQVVFLDARSPDEWDAARRQLRGALRIKPAEVENHLRLIPQGRPIVTYCECPNAICSTRAAAALVQNGWTDVHPLAGGFRAAEKAGMATEARTKETALQRDLA